MKAADLRDPEQFVNQILDEVTAQSRLIPPRWDRQRLLDLVSERDKLMRESPVQENKVIWFALRGPLMCKPRHWKLKCGCAGYGDAVTAWCPSNSNGKVHLFDFSWGYTQEIAWEPIEESGE